MQAQTVTPTQGAIVRAGIVEFFRQMFVVFPRAIADAFEAQTRTVATAAIAGTIVALLIVLGASTIVALAVMLFAAVCAALYLSGRNGTG